MPRAEVVALPPAEPQTEMPAVTNPEPTLPVSGALSNKPLLDNGWGFDPYRPVSYHGDGPVGVAVQSMRGDAHIDFDGEPLANVLGILATDVSVGRRTAQEGLDDLKMIRDRLPQGSVARSCLDQAVRDMDAPVTPVPQVPNCTPAPLWQLAADLHAVPLVRRDPSREQQPLHALLDDFAAGRAGGRGMIRAVHALRNRRHESLGDSGKDEVDRAVDRAVTALEELSRTDRTALYPPSVRERDQS
jgi:hypothetical protein